MFCKTQGIVLHSIKYADKKVITKIYTKQLGIISVNSIIRSTSKSTIARSAIQPLSIIDLEIVFKENREIHELKEAKSIYQYQSIHVEFYKLCIAQFMNEILLKCLKEQSKNDLLFQFIFESLIWLDTLDKGYNNIHIIFMFQLTKFLGFYPLNNFNNDCLYFDMMEGRFQSFKLSYPLGLDKDDSQLIKDLFTYELNSEINYTKNNRDQLLEILLLYYKYHFHGFNNIKSYEVLKETLNT